jgi:hypothetical protein
LAYELTAIVLRHGGHHACTHRCPKDFGGTCIEAQANNTGHYTCITKRKEGWWHLDDNKQPTPESEKSVQQQLQEKNRKGAHPYLLWYQRQDPGTPNKPDTIPENMSGSEEEEEEENIRRRTRTNQKDNGLSKRLKGASKGADSFKIPRRKRNTTDTEANIDRAQDKGDQRRGKTNFPLQLPGKGRRNPPDNKRRAETREADEIIEDAKKQIEEGIREKGENKYIEEWARPTQEQHRGQAMFLAQGKNTLRATTSKAPSPPPNYKPDSPP